MVALPWSPSSPSIFYRRVRFRDPNQTGPIMSRISANLASYPLLLPSDPCSLDKSDIDGVDQLAKYFVQTFGILYYRGDPERLQVCTINIHSLLHFSIHIRDCGPACYWWQFHMERFCGILKLLCLLDQFKPRLSTYPRNHPWTVAWMWWMWRRASNAAIFSL